MNNSGAVRAAAKFTGRDHISQNFRNASNKLAQILAAEPTIVAELFRATRNSFVLSRGLKMKSAPCRSLLLAFSVILFSYFSEYVFCSLGHEIVCASVYER